MPIDRLMSRPLAANILFSTKAHSAQNSRLYPDNRLAGRMNSRDVPLYSLTFRIYEPFLSKFVLERIIFATVFYAIYTMAMKRAAGWQAITAARNTAGITDTLPTF